MKDADMSLRDRVVVWTVATDEAASDRRLAQYRTLLSAEERARADRFVQAADRARFIIARATARMLLSQHAPVDPRAWVFWLTEYGRPELAERPAGTPDLRFNISHTNGLVACAVTVGREVGLDVEHIGRPLLYDVPERFFSPQEVADLRALPVNDQPLAFFDYWTLKEAYIKARGLGLAIPLRLFWFQRNAGIAPAVSFAPELHDDAQSWQFAQFWPTREHRMAVAVRRTGADLAIETAAVVPEVPGGPSGDQ